MNTDKCLLFFGRKKIHKNTQTKTDWVQWWADYCEFNALVIIRISHISLYFVNVARKK